MGFVGLCWFVGLSEGLVACLMWVCGCVVIVFLICIDVRMLGLVWCVCLWLDFVVGCMLDCVLGLVGLTAGDFRLRVCWRVDAI